MAIKTHALLLGLAVMGDLISRMTDIRAHYTDMGVLTRAEYLQNSHFAEMFLPHLINGTYPFQFCLILFQVLCAFSLAIGYRTKLSAFLTWFLLVSLQSHSPFVGHAGDVYTRVVLFWAMFLPTADYFSVDAALKKLRAHPLSYSPTIPSSSTGDTLHFSGASIGLLLHATACYVGSYYFKTGPAWQTTFDATYMALNHAFFQLPMAHVMLSLGREPLRWLTRLTLYWEHYGAFLLYVPFPYLTQPLRFIATLGFWAMHTGFGTSLFVAEFFFFPMATISAFLPSIAWDYILIPFYRRLSGGPLTIYFDRSNGFSRHVAFLLRDVVLPEGSIALPFDQENKKEKDIQWLMIEKVKGDQRFNLSALLLAMRSNPLLLFPTVFLWTTPFLGRLFTYFAHLSQRKASPLRPPLPPRSFSPLNTQQVDIQLIGKVLYLARVFVVQLFLLYVCYLVVHWNLLSLKMVPDSSLSDAARISVWIVRVDQIWNMFSPDPPGGAWWMFAPAELVNGQKVELFRDGAIWEWKYSANVSTDFPANVYKTFRSHRWFKMFENGLIQENKTFLRTGFGQYLCREYNSRYPIEHQLFNFTVHLVERRTLLGPEGGFEILQPKPLWTQQCFPERPDLRKMNRVRPTRVITSSKEGQSNTQPEGSDKPKEEKATEL